MQNEELQQVENWKVDKGKCYKDTNIQDYPILKATI